MKKTISTLLIIFIFSLVLSPILAKEKDSSEDKVTGKERALIAQENNGNRSENVSTRSGDENKKSRIRVAILSRWTAYDKLATKAGQLLDKIQIRINRAKTEGFDTKNSDALMTDARAKLADAKSKLGFLKSLTRKDLDKNGFKEAQKNLQAVHKDLNIVKQDAAKIISNLKSYNESSRSAEKKSSSSAEERD